MRIHAATVKGNGFSATAAPGGTATAPVVKFSALPLVIGAVEATRVRCR